MSKSILVTGSHKSGTTWTGKVTAFSTEIGYLFEPFNPNKIPGRARIGMQHWFKYGSENSSENKNIKNY